MSDTPPEFDWHLNASNEVENQLERLEVVLRKLAERECHDHPLPEPYDPQIVYPPHVIAAADTLVASSNVSDPGVSGIDVFLSYSREDAADFAQELYEDISALGIRCFKDDRSITVADVWSEELRSALRSCRVFVLVVTPQALLSHWCRTEAGAAWGLDRRIVLALRHVRPDALTEPLKSYQARIVETRQQQTDLLNELQSLLSRDNNP